MDHTDIIMVHERQRELAEEANRIRVAGMVRKNRTGKLVSTLHVLFAALAGQHGHKHTEG